MWYKNPKSAADLSQGYTEGFRRFKNKQKSVWSTVFWNMKNMHVYFQSLFNTLYIEIKHKC